MTLPRRPRRGDQLELTVEGLTPKGVGFARLGDYTALIPRGIPGDRVQVELAKPRRREVQARPLALLEPAPQRIEPTCAHFGAPGVERFCGGCSLQALSYADQLRYKAETVRAHLVSAGIDPALLQPIVGMPEPWRYRNKMELSFGGVEDGGVGLGLHPPGWRYEVFSLATCHLQSFATGLLAQTFGAWARAHGQEAHRGPKSGGVLKTLTIREGKRTGDRLVELTTTAAETCWFDGKEVPMAVLVDSFVDTLRALTEVPVTSVYWSAIHAQRGTPTTIASRCLSGSETLHEALHIPGQPVLHFQIHPRAFFQPNTWGAETLYGAVIAAADVPGGAKVLDLYCGTGTIGLCLAPGAAQVIGIELQPDAVKNARENAALNHIHNTTFYAGDVAKVLAAQDLARPGAADVVVVDPPRSGLTARAAELVCRTGAPRLVYVSCNPKALARDLVALGALGWTVRWIRPVDQFPHTAHVENIAVLER